MVSSDEKKGQETYRRDRFCNCKLSLDYSLVLVLEPDTRTSIVLKIVTVPVVPGYRLYSSSTRYIELYFGLRSSVQYIITDTRVLILIQAGKQAQNTKTTIPGTVLAGWFVQFYCYCGIWHCIVV